MALDKFESEKTKDFAKLIDKLPVERRVLVVVDRGETALRRSSENLARAKTILSSYLNPADLLTYENGLFTETALKNLEQTYA